MCPFVSVDDGLAGEVARVQSPFEDASGHRAHVILQLFGETAPDRRGTVRDALRDAIDNGNMQLSEVEVGESVTVGFKGLRSHHPRSELAVCKPEGFVIFAKGYSQQTEIGDRITAKITFQCEPTVR